MRYVLEFTTSAIREASGASTSHFNRGSPKADGALPNISAGLQEAQTQPDHFGFSSRTIASIPHRRKTSSDWHRRHWASTAGVCRALESPPDSIERSHSSPIASGAAGSSGSHRTLQLSCAAAAPIERRPGFRQNTRIIPSIVFAAGDKISLCSRLSTSVAAPFSLKTVVNNVRAA